MQVLDGRNGDKLESERDAMEVPGNKYKQKYRNITVRTTEGSTIRGKVNLGLQERVSDLFIKSERPFIVVTGATHRDGKEKVLVLNKRNIVWVEPED
jgi:hypothetical protein